ncbi:MAG: hypothetical protein KJ964_06395, partial [Verrucomicrobia bacterium]|nr:hypothetical protein [Verrucomicrobiota bacterium]
QSVAKVTKMVAGCEDILTAGQRCDTLVTIGGGLKAGNLAAFRLDNRLLVLLWNNSGNPCEARLKFPEKTVGLTEFATGRQLPAPPSETVVTVPAGEFVVITAKL